MSDLVRAVDVLNACVDARAVADLLVAADARGLPHSLADCPVAVYLRRRSRWEVRVTGNDVLVYHELGRVERAPLPDVVRRFVAAFDAGEFDELRR